MKTKSVYLLLLSVFLLTSLFFTSCNDDVVYYHPQGYRSWFTVKVENDTHYLVNKKGKTFLPVNDMSGYKVTKDHRAYIYYDIPLEAECDPYDYPIRIHYMDTILSKSLAENLGERNDEVYGTDPVRIEYISLEGGFVNIKFGTYWGRLESHFVNLVQENEENPYSLRFRHHAYNDPKAQWGTAWVAFNVEELALEETTGTVTLTVKVLSYNNEVKEYELKYTPGDTGPETAEQEKEEVSSLVFMK
ncbi:MAG: hypothetical protein LUG98_06825 [Tannerellaceae bacterium]|nr:hypothetical protein [Tannerellaceae bacterium]